MAAIPFSPTTNPTKIMANYYATARSNYFAVRDEQAFREWAKILGLEILEPVHRDKVADGIRRYGITPRNGDDSGGWPTSHYNEETDECEDIDVTGQLSAHLADDEVAILMEVGNEKLRYVCGYAVAVNHQGKTVHINLASIYRKALKLGSKITRAEY
jgi:hypothetical protein